MRQTGVICSRTVVGLPERLRVVGGYDARREEGGHAAVFEGCRFSIYGFGGWGNVRSGPFFPEVRSRCRRSLRKSNPWATA